MCVFAHLVLDLTDDTMTTGPSKMLRTGQEMANLTFLSLHMFNDKYEMYK